MRRIGAKLLPRFRRSLELGKGPDEGVLLAGRRIRASHRFTLFLLWRLGTRQHPVTRCGNMTAREVFNHHSLIVSSAVPKP
jgi:hypothetical protein